MKNIIKTFLITPVFLLCFFAFPQDAAGLTFGYTTAGGTRYTANTHACVFTPAQSGTASSISTYVEYNSQGSNLVNAIYSNVSSLPSARLASSSNNAAISTPAAWITTNISLSITGSTPYWLAAGSDSTHPNAFFYFWDAGDAGQRSFYHTTISTPPFPNPWNSGGVSARKVSIYCTYQAGAADARRMFLVE